MKKTRLLQVGIAAAAAALTLSACAGTGATPDPTATETVAAPPQPLTIGFPQDMTSMLPALSYGSKDIQTLDLLYDRLIAVDPATGQLLPDGGLASEWGFTDDTLQVFDLTIKEGIEFQDGTPLDADAVVASLNYARQAAAVQPLSIAAKQLKPVTDVKAIGENEVEITLGAAYSPFPSVLASPPGMIISPKALEAYGTDPTGLQAAQSGAGTGAYKLVSWTKGVGWELEPNPDYWGTAPDLANITITLIPDSQAQLNALQAHQVDLIYSVSPTAVPSLQGNPTLRVESELTPAVSSMQLAGAGPTADPKVRQAINIGIDRGAVAKAIYLTTPDAEVDLPTNIPAEQGSFPATKAPEIIYDTAKAKKLLASAGYPDGFTLLTCAAADDPIQQKLDTILQGQLAEIGITTQVSILPSTGPCNVATAAGTYGAFFGTVQGQIDPYLVYNTELTIAAAGASYPTANAALAEVGKSADRDDQIAAYGELNSIWQDAVPTVMLFSNPMIVGYNGTLKGAAVTYTGEWNLRGLSF